MYLVGIILAVWLCLLQASLCQPTSELQTSGQLRTIYQFPIPTWIENVAVRRNGRLLVTHITAPEIWEVDPSVDTAQLLYRFPAATSVLGIAEVEPDVFAAAVGNVSESNQSVPGSYSMWKVAFKNSTTPRYHHTGKIPTVSKITDVPEASVLNGVCILPGQPNNVLMSDATAGLIYRLNTETGVYSVWADDPLFKPNATALLPLGINGIQVHGKYVYFANSFGVPVLGRVAVTKQGTSRLPAEIIVKTPTYPLIGGAQVDDFAIDDFGNFWLNTNAGNSLVKITPSGQQKVVAGGVNEDVIAGNTAAAFGRTLTDRRTLYVVTNGGLVIPPPGGVTGGKVVAVDTALL